MTRIAQCSDFAWLTARTGYIPMGNARGLAAQAGTRVLGMVVLDHWTPAAAHMHVALDAPAGCRPLLRAAFEYLFVQCERVLARGEVRASNARSLRLAQRLGFVEMGRVRDGWAPGEDLVQLEMRREACRWIGGTHG